MVLHAKSTIPGEASIHSAGIICFAHTSHTMFTYFIEQKSGLIAEESMQYTWMK